MPMTLHEFEATFKAARKIVKYYYHHNDVYNHLEKLAHECNLPVRRFQRDTATRFSSQVLLLGSVLYNHEAQELV